MDIKLIELFRACGDAMRYMALELARAGRQQAFLKAFTKSALPDPNDAPRPGKDETT